MKTLKFRYWDSQYSKFIYSDDFKSATNLQSLTRFFDSAEKHSDGKIQEFTGVKDKKGREIYEGDIVSSVWSKLESIGVVIFWFGEFRLCNKYTFGKQGIPDATAIGNCWYESITGCLTNVPASEFTIIGNIFENSELLEE